MGLFGNCDRGCGCGGNGFGDNWIWIIIIFFFICGNGCDFLEDIFEDECLILILIVLFCCCGKGRRGCEKDRLPGPCGC